MFRRVVAALGLFISIVVGVMLWESLVKVEVNQLLPTPSYVQGQDD